MKKYFAVFLTSILYFLVYLFNNKNVFSHTFLAKEIWRKGENEEMFRRRNEDDVRRKRKVVEKSFLWSEAIIPFDFKDPLPDVSKVLEGIEQWEANTCLRFTKVNNSQKAHIIFQKLNGCRSSVGRKRDPGQVVSIGETCNKVGIIVHEIGHALGFYHEIRRPDRDDFVVINYENILEEEQFNFDKMDLVNNSIPYDLSSVMHYSPLEWSKNGKTTVATKDPMLQGIVGAWKTNESLGLSHRDKLIANVVYGCIDKWLAECKLEGDPCEGEGFIGASCKCVCPRGRKGEFCQIETGAYYDELKSSCSETIRYGVEISSPGYPLRYPNERWCAYEIDGGECRLPSVTILDFELGPRDTLDHCSFDYLEIRNENPYYGVVKCGNELRTGETFKGRTSKMILFFKSEMGGFKGFKARVTFEVDENCCRTFKINSSIHVLSPNISQNNTHQFVCPLHFTPTHPQRLKIFALNFSDDETVANGTSLPFPCHLQYCSSNNNNNNNNTNNNSNNNNNNNNNNCKRFCRRESKKSEVEIILPNSGSIYSFKSSDKEFDERVHLVFTQESSSCHKVLQLNELNPTIRIKRGPLGDRNLQCEWKIVAPKLSHVKLTIEKMRIISFLENSFLIINEIGDLSHFSNVSRTYNQEDEIPTSTVSIKESLSVVVDGTSQTELDFSFQIYTCGDEDEECEYWSSKGECHNNFEWMHTFCKQSCLECEYSVVCRDKELECKYWARNEECSSNKSWMKIYCPKSCGYCDICANQNPHCSLWKALGHCDSNLEYMKIFCRKSCNLCREDYKVVDDLEKETNVTTLLEEKETELVNETISKENSTARRNLISKENSTTNLEADNIPKIFFWKKKKLPVRPSRGKLDSMRFGKRRRNKCKILRRKGNLTFSRNRNRFRNRTINPFILRNHHRKTVLLDRKRLRMFNCNGSIFIRHGKNKIKIKKFKRRKKFCQLFDKKKSL